MTDATAREIEELCAELREGCYTDGCSETKERAANLLEALAPSQASEDAWQEIETAPKSGAVLVAGRWPNSAEPAVAGVQWINIGNCCDAGVFGDWDDDANPTHWRPLPPVGAIARSRVG